MMRRKYGETVLMQMARCAFSLFFRQLGMHGLAIRRRV